MTDKRRYQIKKPPITQSHKCMGGFSCSKRKTGKKEEKNADGNDGSKHAKGTEYNID